MTCFSGCFSIWWAASGGSTQAKPENPQSVARIVTMFRSLVEEKDDYDYHYQLLCQKEPKPIEKEPLKKVKNILEVMIRLRKATEVESQHPAMGDALQMTPRRTMDMDDIVRDAKESHEGHLEKPVPRLSLASTCADLEEDNFNLLDVLHHLDPYTEPVLVTSGILTFLGVSDFARFQTSCRDLSNKKGLLHHCERLLNLRRDDVLLGRAELFAMEIRGCSEEEELQYRNDHPRIEGFKCIAGGIHHWFKADAQSVLRAAKCLKAFCFRANQPFHARCVLWPPMTHAFRSSCKALRHLFAKDVLQILQSGACEDRLHACLCLQEVKSPSKLGRFDNAIVKQLATVAGKLSSVHRQAREEAIAALKHLLPADASRRYPYLLPFFERLQQNDDKTRVKITELIDKLENDIMTVSI